VNDFETEIPTLFGSRVRRVADMGLPGIGNQAFRLMAHARLQMAVESWHHRFPDVDIILIEPEPDDELMFGTSVLEYSSRLQIARHGFESVTHKLARDYKHYKQVAHRHGIEISARRVRKVLDTVEGAEEKDTSAWRRVLEPGQRFVDVGANVGLYTIWALDVGASVIAIEPIDDNLAQLERNLVLNGYDAEIHGCAVAAVAGESYMSGADLSQQALTLHAHNRQLQHSTECACATKHHSKAQQRMHKREPQTENVATFQKRSKSAAVTEQRALLSSLPKAQPGLGF
jgi:FkbM family methyltransferase